jgi:hypothetical protein
MATEMIRKTSKIAATSTLARRLIFIILTVLLSASLLCCSLLDAKAQDAQLLPLSDGLVSWCSEDVIVFSDTEKIYAYDARARKRTGFEIDLRTLHLPDDLKLLSHIECVLVEQDPLLAFRTNADPGEIYIFWRGKGHNLDIDDRILMLQITQQLAVLRSSSDGRACPSTTPFRITCIDVPNRESQGQGVVEAAAQLPDGRLAIAASMPLTGAITLRICKIGFTESTRASTLECLPGMATGIKKTEGLRLNMRGNGNGYVFVGSQENTWVCQIDSRKSECESIVSEFSSLPVTAGSMAGFPEQIIFLASNCIGITRRSQSYEDSLPKCLWHSDPFDTELAYNGIIFPELWISPTARWLVGWLPSMNCESRDHWQSLKAGSEAACGELRIWQIDGRDE